MIICISGVGDAVAVAVGVELGVIVGVLVSVGDGVDAETPVDVGKTVNVSVGFAASVSAMAVRIAASDGVQAARNSAINRVIRAIFFIGSQGINRQARRKKASLDYVNGKQRRCLLETHRAVEL